MNPKLNLKSLSKEDIFLFIEKIGLPRYRAEQLLSWMYKRHAYEIDAITEFSKDLRSHLNGIAFISNLKLVERLQSSDGTEKFLFSLEDGNTIESVLIPDEDRFTLCISSQAGCAIGCQFCLTGKSGLVRSLKSYEIVDQIIAVNKIIKAETTDNKHIPTLVKGGKGGLPDKKITNIVFMGMGEPLMNFDNVVEALWRIIQLIGISKRKITVSTAGIVPKMLLLPLKAPDINLAVSLNAADNETRNRLMPINKKYAIESLISACKKYPLQSGRRITFEYVMIDGINDSPDDAHRLTKLLKGVRCKINLIPLNPHSESDFKRPPGKKVLEFQKILLNKNIRALIRESRGQDILAACGQLRAGNQY
ncbi:MAG: 23S rRNA (adenine(2503)-C(2))-methyltransferase RlmN [Thermodesulfovibrionales bacterium]